MYDSIDYIFFSSSSPLLAKQQRLRGFCACAVI